MGDNEKPDKMIFPIDEKMNASIVENNRDVHTLSWKQSHNVRGCLSFCETFVCSPKMTYMSSSVLMPPLII